MSITALVLTNNEEEMLPLCLARLAWADEMLVVDSGSTDNTVALAKAAGARVLAHDFKDFSDQSNWGLARATGDWVVQVDADELMSPALRDAILRTVAANPDTDIFAVRRDSIAFGHRMRAKSWSGEWIPRLFRRGSVTFAGEVHQDPQVNGRPVGKLDGVLIHCTYRSMAQYFRKFDVYATLWAQKARAGGRRTGLLVASASAVWRVFHNYFIRGEILDGRVGVMTAVLGGMHTFIRHMKLLGLQDAEEFAQILPEDVDDA